MIDPGAIFPPMDEADPAYWAAVFAGHAFVGLVLAAVASVTVGRRFGNPPVAGAETAIFGYFLLWECAWQRLGAGLGDALTDTTAVGLGAIIAAAVVLRRWPWVALAMAGALLELALGIWVRL